MIVTIWSTLSSVTLQVPRATFLSCFGIFNKHTPVARRTSNFHCISRIRHWVQRTSTLRLWRNHVKVLLVKLEFRPTAFWFHFTCLITWMFHIHSHDSTDTHTHSCYILQVITACIWTKSESNIFKNILKWTNFAGSYFLLLYVDCKVWIVFAKCELFLSVLKGIFNIVQSHLAKYYQQLSQFFFNAFFHCSYIKNGFYLC